MLTDSSKKSATVSKIAIVNPYLQGGHLFIAESETAARFVQAGKNLSIDIQVFAKSEEVKDFDPDLVINITYQEGKLTHYPTYVSLNIPIYFLKNVPRFIRNILTCDGFLTVSPSVVNWLNDLCAKHNKPAYISHTAFSVPKTEFVACNFKNALAMYIGTNWDGMRHQDIFHYLSDGNYLKCFGPANSWKNYPASLYGGQIPFDGVSAFNAYREHAAGLCIGHPEFDSAGVANTRIFEIAAASALPICMDNELTKSIYYDSVLYLDANLSTENLARQISSIVQWIRNHPQIAQEMAKEAHACFNQSASMEFYLKNLVDMHERAMKRNGFLKDTLPFKTLDKPKSCYIKTPEENDLAMAKVVYILPIEFLNSEVENGVEDIINDVFNQTYRNIELIVLARNNFSFIERLRKKMQGHESNIHYLFYEGSIKNPELLDFLRRMNPQWIGILSFSDRLFKNHTLSMMTAHHELAKNDSITTIFSGCLEHSIDSVLPELLLDEHNIVNYNKTRIRYVKFSEKVPLVTLLLHADLLKNDLLCNASFFALDNDKLLKWIKKKGKILENPGVTCSISDYSNNPVLQELQDDADMTGKLSVTLIRKIRELQKEVAIKEKKINEIYSSRSWRYTALLRKVMNFCRTIRE